jgi:hypothetical protein
MILRLALELFLVRRNEGPDVLGHVEELGPLLLVQGDGKPAQS